MKCIGLMGHTLSYGGSDEIDSVLKWASTPWLTQRTNDRMLWAPMQEACNLASLTPVIFLSKSYVSGNFLCCFYVASLYFWTLATPGSVSLYRRWSFYVSLTHFLVLVINFNKSTSTNALQKNVPSANIIVQQGVNPGAFQTHPCGNWVM